MGISSAVFESAGKMTEHFIPGVYDRTNNITTPAGISQGNLCIIGKSAGGKPQTLLSFSSLAEAKDVLVGGELLEAVGHAFKCSPNYSPNRVYAMRINPGTQAKRKVVTSLDNGTDIFNLSSWDYGTHTNQLKMRLTKNTTDSTYSVSVMYKGNEVKKDKIGRSSFSVQALMYSTDINVNNDCITLTTRPREDEGATSTTLTIRFDEAVYISEVVDKINDFVDLNGDRVFSASLIDLRINVLSSELDVVGGETILVDEDVNGTYTFRSDVQALAESLRTIQYIGDVEIVNRCLPMNDETYIYFSGGSEGTSELEDWANTIDALANENIQIITTPSSDEWIHSLIVSHCVEMSNTKNKKERTCILGGSLDETISDAAKKAGSTFATEYASYICDSIIALNPFTNKAETLPASYTACKVAGLESALSVATPLTNKALSVLGFVNKRSTKDLETMIASGIMPCAENEQGTFVVIRAMTTYQGDDLKRCERSMVRESLFMNRDLRQAFYPLIGQNGIISASDATAILSGKGKEWANRGCIVPSDKGENVWDISVRTSGDKTFITYSRYLAAPINFVFITANNYTYSSETVEL